MTEEQVLAELVRCAAGSIGSLVAHKLRVEVTTVLRRNIDFGFDPRQPNPASGLIEAVNRTKTRIISKLDHDYGDDNLSNRFSEITSELNRSIADGAWRMQFPGRNILKLLAGQHIRGIPYEAFRDAIVARMVDAGYRPTGMETIINTILDE
jgi:hypothetical protein